MPTMRIPSHPRNLLLIAAREPTPGTTKTRLGKAIGMERAAELYRAFLTDLADRFEQRPSDGFVTGWSYSPPECDFSETLMSLGQPPAFGTVLLPQEGDGWGVRQANILRWGAEHGYERTILIASDSPHLSRGAVTDAFRALDTADVVMGRVRDGGYYLIGMRGYHDVLSGLQMSTATVADGLLARAHHLGLATAEVAPTFDVDEAGDLELLIAELAPDGHAAPATWSALAALGLRPPSIFPLATPSASALAARP